MQNLPIFEGILRILKQLPLKLLSTQEGKPFEELLGGNTSFESTNLSNLGDLALLGPQGEAKGMETHVNVYHCGKGTWEPKFSSYRTFQNRANTQLFGGHVGNLIK